MEILKDNVHVCVCVCATQRKRKREREREREKYAPIADSAMLRNTETNLLLHAMLHDCF